MVLSFPYQLRFLFASYPEIMSKVLAIVYRTIAHTSLAIQENKITYFVVVATVSEPSIPVTVTDAGADPILRTVSIH